MKKKFLILPIALLGLVLSSCGVSTLKDNYTAEDQAIETPWSDYVMPATGIEFEDGEETLSLVKGETHAYRYSIQPRGATVNSLNWFSDNENVATVSDGVVSAVGGGEATITVSVPDSDFEAQELDVNVIVPLTNFALEVPEKLVWEEEYQFPVTYEPEDTTERDLTYKITESSVAGLLSVSEEGLVTTTKQNGTAKLEVSRGNIVKEYTLTVDSTPVTSVSIADAGHEIEVNDTLSLAATVSPATARDYLKDGVRFYSKDPSIATIDERTGVVLGVAVGNTNVYAECGDVKSADYAIEVFKVTATNVSITTPDFTLSNASQTGLSKQLAYQLTVDRAGYDKPSAADISFVSSNDRVVAVSDAGLVTAIGPGTAEVTIKVAQEGEPLLEDSVNVSVNIVSTALTISGGNSFFNDSTLTLTASLTPANVSNSDITWSLEQDPVIVSLSDTAGPSVTLTPINNEVTGTVKVIASNPGGASNEMIVTVDERPSEFTAGRHYIVGNELYNTGESVRVAGKSSWETAKYAYEFSYRIDDPSVYEQFKGTIKFAAGDQFRYFIGKDYWVPVYETFGENRGYHIEQDGDNNAFHKGQMRFVKENENHEFVVSDADDANIEVVEAGWYDLYAKLYKNSDDTVWYSLYIEKVPALSVEVDNITMGLDESYQIKPHNWIGGVDYTIVSGEDYISINSNGLAVAKGVAGNAVVRVNDDRNVPVDVTFTLQAGAHAGQVIYLNANGMFDNDEVVPFVHSWGNEGASNSANTMMEKVEGQTIIYSATIPFDHNKVDFVRCAAGSTSLVWDEIYNQTKDQDIPADKDMFTMTGWSDEQDDHHRTYVDGSWSVFDSAQVYTVDSGSSTQPEDPHGESYVMYGNDPTWNYLPLEENLNNANEMMGSIALEKDTEFVIKMGEDDWRHFENNKASSSNKVIQGSEANAEGTLHNFKANADGTYSFYILKDKAAEEGKNVYVGFVSNTPAVPNVVKLYFEDALEWATGENKMFAYAWGDAGNKVAWPGEEATYVGLDNADKKVYSFDVDINAYNRIIFHAGEAQTADIDISEALNNQGYKPTALVNNAYAVENYVYTPKGDTPVTYTVSFDTNGGTGTIDPSEVNGAYTLPDATGLTAPTNKEFAGWKAGNAGDLLAAGDHYNVTANVTFYAQWEEAHVANNVKLYLTANWAGWESPKAYAFNAESETPKVAWPGENMNYVGVNDDNDTIFSYTVDIASYDRIIFHNGSGAQTVDIDISTAANADAYYLKQHVDNNDANKIEVEKWGTFTNASLTSKQIIYFTNNKGWTDVKFYVFNKALETKEADWPGSAAKWVFKNENHEDVYRLLINTAEFDAFIFNGSGGQTIDILLSSLEEGKNAFYILDEQESGNYKVGQWAYNPLA
ncbi:MAG: starch-binding protein [Bacilli bacterium]|nr:starch-binding protein [Bacilli bacterium]